MKEKISKLAHVVIFSLIFIIVFNKVSNIMMAKNSRAKYYEFYNTSGSIDVFFMGTSLVINGIMPMQLYDNYGITSYNFGNHASQFPTTYYTLLNLLNNKKPKVVVVDIYTIGTMVKIFDNISYAHTTFDYIPITFDKVCAVNDLFVTLDEKVEMLFPFAKYHTRWKDLTYNDFNSELDANGYRGAEDRIRVEEAAIKYELNEEMVIDDTYSLGKEYLEKAIELCKKNGVEVVLTLMPHSLDKRGQEIYNYGYLMAEKYDIDYIDFNTIEDIVNYDCDFYDLNGHLNPSGAKKVTDYLGKYLSAKFDLKDYRDDEDYEFWDKDYEKYVSSNIKNLNNYKGKINEYLMLLNNDEYECVISVSDRITEENNSLIYTLINNIYEIQKVDIEGVDARTVYTNILSVDIEDVSTDADINITVYRKSTGKQISSTKFVVNEYSNLEVVK